MIRIPLACILYFSGVICVLGIPCGMAATPRAPDFQREVRPILAQHCLRCHGFDEATREADLRLDTDQGLRDARPSGTRVIVPGEPAASGLYQRVTAHDPDIRMPPADAGEALTREQIDVLEAWIAAGGVWESHWAFERPTRPPVPRPQHPTWPSNAIDCFVLARMQQVGLTPSPPADRGTLIRRVYLDVLGLPPTPAQIERFLSDTQPGAYARLVDRVLASPHYGERIGRHWLDAARYADSAGYANDNVRSIWLYRDWVIHAFNQDMPFDQFTIEQLAGDLLDNPTWEQRVATGFHRNTPHQYEGGTDAEQYRVERVKNRVDTTGTVWLGMTIGCAQCHTHKYDPVTQKEYYQLYAFFNQAEEPKIHVPPVTRRAYLRDLQAQIAAISQSAAPATEEGTGEETAARRKELESERDKLLKSSPATLVMQRQQTDRETHVQVRGDFLQPGERVTPGFPGLFAPPKTSGVPTRLDLARWLVEPAHPLTARVLVNRLWQQHFGLGLVKTENDFGHQGSPPSHPALLDWLATEFLELDYSIKALQRTILLSSTYRQSSRVRPELAVRDPENRYLARQMRIRVEGEIVRDLALATSGVLCRNMGGPGLFPPVPPQVIGTSSARHKWPESRGAERFRRGVYTVVYRANVYPMFSTFDGPDRDNACTRRNRSNTPLQSLTLANGPTMVELARAFAVRILHADCQDDARRIEYAFTVAVSRTPSHSEAERLIRFLKRQKEAFQGDPEAAEAVVGNLAQIGFSETLSADEAAAWTSLARVILNLDEFIVRE